MSRKLVVLSVICSMIILFIISCGVPEGEQGISNDFDYTDRSGKSSTTRVRVTRTSKKGSNPTILIVKFKFTNTGKTPVVFSWTNKYIMDDEGRIFKPYQGIKSVEVPPTYTVEEQYCVYKLPDHIAAGTLWWGLLNKEEDGLAYKIKLY